MRQVAGLDFPPNFLPVLGDIYKGMATTVMLQNHLLNGTPNAQTSTICWPATTRTRSWSRSPPSEGPVPGCNQPAGGKGQPEITVSGTQEQTLLTAQFDNLGKGASGAAVQNMNIMMGFEETAGLSL